MEPLCDQKDFPAAAVAPLCPVFGTCQGCLYQNIRYDDELRIKERGLKGLLCGALNLSEDLFAPIVPSPKPYHYRNRLDLKLKRTKDSGVLIGFTPVNRRGVLPVEDCFIAEEAIAEFIPELKRQAVDCLPAKYRIANLTVRTGADGRVFWGGIGRGSNSLLPKDYLWADISGRRVYYSLDTFFQANLSILTALFETLRGLGIWEPAPLLYDLYGGVGLFAVGLSATVAKSILVEENPASVELARYNILTNRLDGIRIVEAKVEDAFPRLFWENRGRAQVAIVDPPRAGLHHKARMCLAPARGLSHLLYLSCHPESLARDLKIFMEEGWNIKRVMPFDFFPKTQHLETLVLLEGPEK